MICAGFVLISGRNIEQRLRLLGCAARLLLLLLLNHLQRELVLEGSLDQLLGLLGEGTNMPHLNEGDEAVAMSQASANLLNAYLRLCDKYTDVIIGESKWYDKV